MREAAPILDEITLIRRFQAGDKAAYRQIYSLQLRPLQVFATHIVQDDLVAEDIVAETFIKVWIRRANFFSYPALMGFLYLVTRNACLDHLKNTQRRKGFHERMAYSSERSQEAVDHALVRAELLQLILLEISALPPKMQEVFRLIFLEGLSLPEIVEQLDISYNTVKVHRAAALKKVRAAMAKKGISNATLSLLGF